MFSQFGPAVWPAITNIIYMSEELYNIDYQTNPKQTDKTNIDKNILKIKNNIF